MKNTTCGQLYHELMTTLFPLLGDASYGLHALIHDCPEDPPAYAAFALGFIAGQAEKVASGACPAFMIRPAPAWHDWTEQAMELVCGHYGLLLYALRRHGEFWGYLRESIVAPVDLACIATEAPNTPHWHATRARLCGIAPAQVDIAYHLRDGHGRRCEPGEDAHYGG